MIEFKYKLMIWTDEQVDKNMLRWVACEGIVCITRNAKFVKNTYSKK